MTPGDLLARWEAVAEPGQVAAFERAIHRPGGDGADVLPPTFLVALSAGFTERLVTEVLPVERHRLLHGEQSFEWLGEVRAGATLSAEARLADLSEKRGSQGTLRFFTIETLWSTEGKLVCRDRSVIVERGP